MGPWGRRILERARRIAEQTGDPYLRGLSAIVTGIAAMPRGRWAEVLRESDQGVRILGEKCQGVSWERDQGRMVSLRALEELGDIPEFVRRTESFRREAEETGDLYAQIIARQYAAFWRLAGGDAPGARAETRATVSLWTHRGYYLQHFYALRLEVCCDLYEGDVAAALARLLAAWPAVKRSGLLRHPVVRVDAHLLRGRAMLAAAAAGIGAGGELRAAARSARRLAREARADTGGHADLVRAGIAAVRGRRPRALEALARARECFEAEGLRLAAAYASRRWGELTGGAEGDEIVRAADGVLAGAAIKSPARWLAVHAPGFTQR